MLYQQGDVSIESVAEMPARACPVPPRDGRHVLAEGELTGHAHAVEDDIELCRADGALYCRAETPFVVRHEEHRPITIPRGTYHVRRVRVFDHFSGATHSVLE